MAISPPDKHGPATPIAAPGNDHRGMPSVIGTEHHGVRPLRCHPIEADELALRYTSEQWLSYHAATITRSNLIASGHARQTYKRDRVPRPWGIHQWLHHAALGRNETGLGWCRHNKYDSQ